MQFNEGGLRLLGWRNSSILTIPMYFRDATATPPVKVSSSKGYAWARLSSRICKSMTMTSSYGSLLDINSLMPDRTSVEWKQMGALTKDSPFGHQGVLFEPAIEHNGTEEQRAYWLPLAQSGRILSTYCQTELGHGSFVRGIETTATFNQRTDEFIVHSPTVSSAKVWPASLAFSTTHAVVMTKLIVSEGNLGHHLFLVQIRSLDDGRSRTGI